jgi:hypothetical protein
MLVAFLIFNPLWPLTWWLVPPAIVFSELYGQRTLVPPNSPFLRV